MHNKQATELNLQGQVLSALISSTTPLHQLSLLLGGICTLILLNSQHISLVIMSLTGLITMLLQSYYHWRVSLDKQLLPILLSGTTAQFDQALGSVFPTKAESLADRSTMQRLTGIKRLFLIECSLTLLLTCVTLTCLLTHSAFIFL